MLCLTTLLFAAGAALFFTNAAVIPYKEIGRAHV